MSAILARGLRKRFGGREALSGVSVEVAAGTCFAVFGPNGSGKSTLVRILAALSTPTEGDVEVAGYSLRSRPEEARARTGVMLDHHLMPRDFTLAEGLRFYADLYGIAAPRARIEEVAQRVGLHGRLADRLRSYSRGMAQRASLARALLHDPQVLLLDEPFNGLDPAGCAIVEDVIEEAKSRSRAVLLVTHDIERGLACAERAALLVRGRVAAEGPPAEIAGRLAELLPGAGVAP